MRNIEAKDLVYINLGALKRLRQAQCYVVKELNYSPQLNKFLQGSEKPEV